MSQDAGFKFAEEYQTGFRIDSANAHWTTRKGFYRNTTTDRRLYDTLFVCKIVQKTRMPQCERAEITHMLPRFTKPYLETEIKRFRICILV